MRALRRLLLATVLTTALAIPAVASAVPVTVRPEGRAFTASGNLTLTMRSPLLIPIACAMTGSGVIPPASTINDGTAGSVSTTILFTASCTPTGSTILSGVWSINWTRIGGRQFATLTLPDSAITKYIGGCAFIMPVFQPVTLTGFWEASALGFRNQELDVMFAGCGSMTPGPFEVLNGTLTFSSGGNQVTIT